MLSASLNKTFPSFLRNERWAGRYRHWRLQRWHDVLLSDESRFHLRNADGRMKVWCRHEERYHNDCFVQTDRWGGGGVGGGVCDDGGRHQISSPYSTPYLSWQNERHLLLE